MNRFRQNRCVRLVAITAALAMALVPADVMASCGCGDCPCRAAQDDAAACCCSGAAEKSAKKSCCTSAPKAGNCCSGQAACSTDGSCRCEVSSTQPTANPAARVVRPAKADQFAAVPGDLLPALTSSPAFGRVAVSHPPDSGPPLRILYCSWRN